MMLKFKAYIPYIIGLIIFSAFIFSPELQGKKLGSHDSVSWYGAAKELLIYQEKGEDIKWTNRVFSGMPLYMIGGEFYGNLMMKVYYKLSEIFPIQIFNYSIILFCLFISLILLGIKRNISFIFSILFSINTWVIDSLIASHSSKILSIGFGSLVLSGLYKYFIKDKTIGLVPISIGMLMLLGMNHYQIVYYVAIVVSIFIIFIIFIYFINKQILNFLKKSALTLILVFLALLANFSNIWISKDYSKDTMRGGKTELIKPEANSTSKEGGLDINYAFSWSYTPSELFNFMVPDAKGGASGYAVKPGKSKLAEAIGQEKAPLYWGEQPFTGAPNYVGVALFFLVVFTFFYWKNSLRWLFLAIILLFSAMGLGRFFLELNQLLFDYLPFYNKFRTPTMSFSMVNLSFVILGGLGLNHLLKNENKVEALKALKFSLYTMAGIMIVGFINISSEGYTSTDDTQKFAQYPQLLPLAIEDRESFFKGDFFRSLFIIASLAGLIWAYITQKLEQKWFIVVLGILMVSELYLVSNRYYDKEAFQKTENIEDLIPNEPYNQYMANDTTYFRMFNTTINAFNDNTDGYRYSNVGGYSPAKLYRYQDLIDVHLSKMNMNVLNMLNTKYFVVEQNGQKIVQQNSEACGNVWFPSQVKFAKNANEEMDSIGMSNPKQTVWVDTRYNKESQFDANTDPNATIYLSKYHPERMEYQSNSKTGGFAIFSEIWYRGNEDWKIYIDGKESKMIRTNYLLRGAYIPAGIHIIDMKYTQSKLDLYRTIGQVSSLILFIFLIGIVFKDQKTKFKGVSMS
jgi:hypothetical protein